MYFVDLTRDRDVIGIFADAVRSVVGAQHPVVQDLSSALMTGDQSYLSSARNSFDRLPGSRRRRVRESSELMAQDHVEKRRAQRQAHGKRSIFARKAPQAPQAVTEMAW